MSFLVAVPELIADAAGDLTNIGTTVSSANTAVAAATTSILPPAADEVSTQIAALFSTHAVNYQKVSAQAAAFHEQFVKTLTAGASTYAAAEANVVQSLGAEAPALGGGLAGLGTTLGGELGGLGASLNAGLPGGALGGSLVGLAQTGESLGANSAAAVPVNRPGNAGGS